MICPMSGGCSCSGGARGEASGINRIDRLVREKWLTVRKRKARRKAIDSPRMPGAQANRAKVPSALSWRQLLRLGAGQEDLRWGASKARLWF